MAKRWNRRSTSEYKGYDMAKTTNGWYRDGLFYKTNVHVYRHGRLYGKITRKLDPISYHLIKLIHGDRKLREMAYDLSRLPDVQG